MHAKELQSTTSKDKIICFIELRCCSVYLHKIHVKSFFFGKTVFGRWSGGAQSPSSQFRGGNRSDGWCDPKVNILYYYNITISL